MAHTTKLISLDCGETETGAVVLTTSGIREGLNMANDQVIDFILVEKERCYDFTLLIEDVRPYNMRITDGIIHTIKFLGQLEWRLTEMRIPFTLIPRWQVKRWIFEQYKPVVLPEIQKKIDYSNKQRTAKGIALSRKQTPSFVYVDDRIVQKAMRLHWQIPKAKVGHKAMYNLKDHSWQALALASFYLTTS